MSRPIQRGDVYWVVLDPTIGTEVRKTRPALIISPNEMNMHLPRVIIAPLTSTCLDLACRPDVKFKGKRGQIMLDQLRSIDKRRLHAYMGKIDPSIWHATLIEMLA